jgi:hypothetical protein
LEAVHDILFCAGHVAGLVRIFYTEDEPAVVLADKKVVV